MKKLIVSSQITLILLFLGLLFWGCSTHDKSELSKRYPASVEDSCQNILSEVFDLSSSSHEALHRVDELEKVGNSPEKRVNFEDYLTEIFEKILPYKDEELVNSWSQLMSSFQYMKSLEGENFNFHDPSWVGLKRDFFKKWRSAEKAYRPFEEVSTSLSPLIKEVEGELEDLSVKELAGVELRSSLAQEIWLNAQGLTQKEERDELRDFSYWVYAKGELQFGEDIASSFHSFLKEYRQEVSSLSKKSRREYILEGKKKILPLQNYLVERGIDDIGDPGELRKRTLSYLEFFSLLEDRFEKNRFLSYLQEDGFFTQKKIAHYKNLKERENIDINLGMMLREKYQEFAPFQDRLPVVKESFMEKAQEEVKSLWDHLLKAQAPCQDLDCYNKKARSHWRNFFKRETYKKKFSCLASNPVTLKMMVMDLGIAWGGISWYYSKRAEKFQRFPYEIIFNGALFAPFLAEANCRSSFKGDLSFGTTLLESEVLPLLKRRTLRTLKKLQGLALRGALASVGLLTMTKGFDHLFLGLGYKIATPLALNDIAVLIPLSFLYHGIWSGLKNMAIVNPIRHKIIPRLAKKFAEKKGLSSAYWPLQTGLDFGAYWSLAEYGRWDYLTFYAGFLFPMVQKSFSAGTDLEHREILNKDGTVRHQFIGVKQDSGVRSEVTLKENKEEGSVELESVEVEVSDKTLDNWAEQILTHLDSD